MIEIRAEDVNGQPVELNSRTHAVDAPVIRCAACGEPIKNALKAIVVLWRHDRFKGRLDKPEVFHKGVCDRSSNPRLTGWMELEVVLANALRNAGMTTERVEERLRVRDEMGV